VTAAQRHDDLDAALDRLVAGQPVDVSGTLDPSLGPLVQTARATRDAFAVELPSDLAARHLAALGVVRPIEQARSRRRRIATIVLAAAVGLMLLGGTAVAASGSALPGDLLYPVKRAVEHVDLALHHGASARAKLHLEFARRRLDELSQLLAKRRNGESVDIGAAMSAYQDEISNVQDAVAADALGQDFQALLASVQTELSKHVSVLTDLQSKVPEQARDAIQNAIARAQTAEQKVMQGRIDHGKPATPHGNSSRSSRSR
jgi:uncharacterized protein DUF5667